MFGHERGADRIDNKQPHQVGLIKIAKRSLGWQIIVVQQPGCDDNLLEWRLGLQKLSGGCNTIFVADIDGVPVRIGAGRLRA